ncbi:uncharacterized protein BXZ73DRAFT_89851 [Epithele typhae]|uniref:uncharacterized protein n=1 Tax=Epithele typhae TaxID=378194 RepID=UPI00200743B8|nr:uncharacterized protein BXZ73DRAFT_89851 [Epithele typhae]KAH9933237.1 hypothetical protein BXZ73DRAFT_89851 [Epithele typhae]
MVQGQTKGLSKQKGNTSRHAQRAAAATKKGKRHVAPRRLRFAKINKSIEQQVATAASSGKLTIMKNVAMEG